MALFGNKEEKEAEDQAARAEIDRLLSLPVPELAAEIMPAFGPDGARPGREVGLLQVANWLLRDHRRGVKYLKELLDPIREAVQALEHAELVLRLGHGSGENARLKATRLGEQALAEGNVAKYLRG
jgi:hypothetical protein